MRLKFHRFLLWQTLTLACLLGSIAVLPSSFGAEPRLVDGIAAVVNGEPITMSEVRIHLIARERQLREAYRGQELVEQIKKTQKATLEDLIDRKLILHEFKKMEAHIPDYVIEDRIKALIREEFEGDRNLFLQELRKQGFTMKKFRELEKDKLVVLAMRQQNVPKQPVVVPPQRVEEYYKEHRSEYTKEGKIKLRMITIKKHPDDPGNTEDTQLAVAKEIRSKLLSGADFHRMAQMYSQDGLAEYGGDWGWIEPHTLNQELSKIAFNLKKGAVSDIIDFSDNFYILQVEDKVYSKTKPLSELREQIREQLEQEERQKIERRWVDTLRKKAYIKVY